MQIVIFYTLGYIFSLYCSSQVGNLVKALWKNANLFRLERYNTQTSILGYTDVTFYFLVFSIIINSNNIKELLFLVGAWLTLKSLPSIWKNKSEEKYEVCDLGRKPGTGGERYNIYLVGTLLSLLIAFVGSIVSFLLVKTDWFGEVMFPIPSGFLAILLIVFVPLVIQFFISSININPTDDHEEDLKNLRPESEN